MRKLLAIYNTCGISGRDNTAYYLDAIKSILTQDFDDFEVLVSSCLNSKMTELTLQEEFGDRISYNFIHDILPLPVTFNHSLQKGVEKFGPFEGYLFIDSGIKFTAATQIAEMYNVFKSGPNSMVAAQTDTDSGYLQWFGIGKAHNDTSQNHLLFQGKNFVIPVGKAINLHCQIFGHSLFETYGSKVYPDIFAGFCSESVFTFLTAAINTYWVICKDVLVTHGHGLDEGSSGFLPKKWLYSGKQTWNHPFIIPDLMERINPGTPLGIGYEECQNILMHDESQYDENGFCKNAELKTFIKNNLFLQPNEFDYGKINHVFS